MTTAKDTPKMSHARLFHVSEEQGIVQFVPRMPSARNHPITEPVVWAIAEDRLYHYLVPRDCPRLAFYASENTRDEDVLALLDGQRNKIVLAAESGWYGRMADTPLVRYELAPDGFTLFLPTAGFYLSRHTETPIAVEVIANPLEALLASGVEVRLTPSLWELRERVLGSSMEFSFTRMRNAAPPAAGYGAYHPV